MTEGESKSESVYEAFLDISRCPYTEANRVIFGKFSRGKREYDDARNLWDFENRGIFLPPREREEIAEEARRRGANVVIQSQSARYGRPYIFLRLNDERFLNRIGSWALRF